ncbi:hypothetical protein D3C80_1765310 [compost metagenome]
MPRLIVEGEGSTLRYLVVDCRLINKQQGGNAAYDAAAAFRIMEQLKLLLAIAKVWCELVCRCLSERYMHLSFLDSRNS